VRKIASEARLCKICMEQHDVDVVEVMDEEIFKGEEVVFKATYEYWSKMRMSIWKQKKWSSETALP